MARYQTALFLWLLTAGALAGPSDVCGPTHNIPFAGNAIQITADPVNALDSDGKLAIQGWSSNPDAIVVNKGDIPLLERFRYKSWHWFSVTTSDGVYIQAMIGIFGSTSVIGSYSAQCQIRGFDAPRGTRFDYAAEGTSEVLGYLAHVDPDGHDSSFENGKVECKLALTGEGDAARLTVSMWAKHSLLTSTKAFTASFVAKPADYIATAGPLADGLKYWFVGKKAAGWEVLSGSASRKLEGDGESGYATYDLAGATYNQDHCEGMWPSMWLNPSGPVSTWRWMTASKRLPDGRILGLNLDDRTGDQRAAGSAFVSLAGVVRKINSPLTFQVVDGSSWTITATDGSLNAYFSINKWTSYSVKQLFINTTQNLFYGTLSGNVLAANGETVNFSIYSFSEDFCGNSW